ncbi:MAG: energy transducer TonB, partial [Gammaproteobacteria bacterium]|nr:energy transducer TonB [Gammaproteobacteria bacterium]
LVRSSGYRRLDRAALTTMRDSAPFPGITAYLRQPQPFKLQIEYALDS